MHVDVAFTPAELDAGAVAGTAVAVVDVLRTSTTIVTALSAGAVGVLPASGPTEASQLASRIGRKDVLLCGERGGKIIEGFDLGNSPYEYTPDVVSGRTLIFATTNGTPAIVKTEDAALVAVVCFANIGAAAALLRSSSIDRITVAATGKEGRFALEDAVCAGRLVELLGEAELSDGARAAVTLSTKFGKRPLALLQQCEHGRYLASIGFAADLRACARVDAFDVVPVVKEGRITLQKQNG